jgi:hypothetical protein
MFAPVESIPARPAPITRMPGNRYCRYSVVDPATEPPNRYTNNTRNMAGVTTLLSTAPGFRPVFARLRRASTALCRSVMTPPFR